MGERLNTITTAWRGSRSRRVTGTLGAVIVITMLLVCLGSLPYTLGSAPTVGAGAMPSGLQPARYEATNSDLALLPPYWAPHAPDERAQIDAFTEATGRTPRHLFGTDQLGRDLFVRCLAGGGVSLSIGLAAACVAVIIGTLYGSLSGYAGGRVDAMMMRLVDIFYGLPNILLVVLLTVAVDGLVGRLDASAYAAQLAAEQAGEPIVPLPGYVQFLQANRGLINALTLLVAVGGVTWLTMARVIRGQVLSLKQQPFMEACRATGVPLRRQFLRHLLPNLMGPIIVYATLTVPAAILSESFLSFLGIGVREPLPSWGNLAAAGLGELNIVRSRWWLLLWPCLFIAIALLALNFVGEGLREALDPKRRSVD